MTNAYFNKQLGIGNGGINCTCCVDVAVGHCNHKLFYRRRKRRVMKQELRRQLDG